MNHWRQLAGLRHGTGDTDVQVLARQNANLQARRNVITDLFLALWLQADQEQRVALLNNYWQLLWRASRQAGIAQGSDYMKRLDATMGSWWTWKQQYNDAILRRWVPFTRAWNDELDHWSEQFQALSTDACVVSPKVCEILTLQGVDVTRVTPDDTSRIVTALKKRTGEVLGSALFWPVVIGVGALLAAGYGLKLYKDFRQTHVEHV